MTARLNSFRTLFCGICFSKNGIRAMTVLSVAVVCLSACAQASADTLFWEDFNGYTVFNDEHPANDWTNAGLPEISEGADELWYGGRFQTPDAGTIQQDLAVQEFGGSPNNTPVGRAEDEAGLLFNVDTTGYLSITLDYDWRLFSGGSGDVLRVGYFVGSITGFAGDRTKNMIGEWGNWTQILVGSSSSWMHDTEPLPAGQSSVWVAFWMDNGEGDFIKIDNIHVQGELVPEPTTFVLAGFGIVAVGYVAIRRRARQAMVRVRACA
ncbi:MAG: PEP-CTERM sorting domain-containing protein [Pirellulales bacterium]